MDGAMRGLAEALDADSAWLTAAAGRAGREGRAAAGRRPGHRPHAAVLPARRSRRATDRRPRRRACGPATTSAPSTACPRATCRRSRACACCGARSARTVKLTVLRGSAAEPHEVSLMREKLPASQVTGRIASGHVGVVRIAAFGNGHGRRDRRAVADLQKQGADAAGPRRCAAPSSRALADGIEAARLFVALRHADPARTAGPETRRRSPRKPGDGSIDLPTVVLTSNGTSGAAEMLVAARVRQRSRADRRRAHARPRRRAEARAAHRRQRSVDDVRALPDARRQADPRAGGRARPSPSKSPTSSSAPSRPPTTRSSTRPSRRSPSRRRPDRGPAAWGW